MTTFIDGGAKPLDPRTEGAQRRLASYSPDEHVDLVCHVGCDHPAIVIDNGTWYQWCDRCTDRRELELAEGVS